MGYSSYMRGSMAITRGICREVGCSGCAACRPTKPDKRPPEWGEKSRSRAAEMARRILEAREKYGLPVPCEEVLSGAIQMRARVSESAARAAATDALRREIDNGSDA